MLSALYQVCDVDVYAMRPSGAYKCLSHTDLLLYAQYTYVNMGHTQSNIAIYETFSEGNSRRI